VNPRQNRPCGRPWYTFTLPTSAAGEWGGARAREREKETETEREEEEGCGRRRKKSKRRRQREEEEGKEGRVVGRSGLLLPVAAVTASPRATWGAARGPKKAAEE